MPEQEAMAPNGRESKGRLWIRRALAMAKMEIAHWFHLANSRSSRKAKRDARRRKWEIILAMVPLIITILPLSISVLWRWGCWLLCWVIAAVFLGYELPYRLPRKTRIVFCILLLIPFAMFRGLARSQWRIEQASAVEGDLLGGSAYAFDDIRSKAPIDMQVGAAGTKFTFALADPSDSAGIKWFMDAGLKIEQGRRGPIVSTAIRDRNGNLVVELRRNHWKIYPQFCSDKNYTDKSLEVLDNAGHVVLQLVLIKEPSTVHIQGEWWNIHGEGRRLIEVPGGALVIPLLANRDNDNELIAPIFEYPSEYNWGVQTQDKKKLWGIP